MNDLSESDWRRRTPARILTGRAGASYRTATLLQLRHDHAAARDAVHAEIELEHDLPGLFEVRSQATSKAHYLMRPDLGRLFNAEARATLTERCPRGVDVQVVVGDGLSATAVRTQVPELLPLLAAGAHARGWRTGQAFFVRYCRVGVVNEVGELLDPTVVVLLIGERPGLATAESLSAYLAYRPRSGQTDAQRNLVSNIHAQGIGRAEAVSRILALAGQLIELKTSGVAIKEQLSERALLP